MVVTGLVTLAGMFAGQAFGAFVVSKRNKFFEEISSQEKETFEDINSSIENERKILDALKKREQDLKARKAR